MIPQKPSTVETGRPEERVRLEVRSVLAGRDAAVRVAWPSLVVTMEAGAIGVSIGGRVFPVDRASCLLVPGGTRFSLQAAAGTSRVVILGFGAACVAKVARAYVELGLERARLERWLARTETLPRTVWVHEIVHRYVFERHALGVSDNLTTRFLETEILKEVYYLFRDREEGADRAPAAHTYSAPVARALAYIEAHLFEPCSMRQLAVRAGASESTLLRSFHREVGSAPSTYWRVRRLDEALVLLRSGRHSVEEVATLVGYVNATAFGHAFRLRFGKAPTAFRARRPTRAAP